jgi:hypothetical protein
MWEGKALGLGKERKSAKLLLTFLLDIYFMPLPFTAGIKKWNIDHFERQYPSPYDMNHGMDEILSRILCSIQEFWDFLMKHLNFSQRPKKLKNI